MAYHIVAQVVAILAFVLQLAAADGLVTVQANDPAIEYSNNVQWSQSEACGGTQYSFGLGQWFSYQFTGTSISIVGTVDQYGGILTITLDGVQSTFNRYSSHMGPGSYDPQCSTTLFTQSGLAATQHTLIVNHTSASNGGTAGANQFFEWQYLQYYQTEAHVQTTSKSNIPAIAAGAGGGVAIIVIIALLWWYLRRNRNKDLVFPVDLAGDGAPPGLTNVVVEPFVPPPRPVSQVDSTRRQSRVLHKRSSSASLKPVSSTNVPTMPYAPGSNQRPASISAAPREMPNIPIRRSSIAKGPSADDTEFNPYALAPRARPTSMIEVSGTMSRPLSGDFSVAGSSSYNQPSSSREPSSQAAFLPEKGSIAVTNPDAPGPSSPIPMSPHLPDEVVNQLPALSDADMARLAAQVATMLRPGAAQPSPSPAPQPRQQGPPRDSADDAPPEYSQVARQR